MLKLPRIVTAAVVTATIAVACTPEPPKFAFKHNEKRGKLESNGIRFVLMPDASTDLVNVAVRWEVGSREDPPGKAGLAHVVEHLMFQPRPDGPNSPPLFQSIINLAVGGDFNAYTAEDMTHYYETVRAEDLDAALKIEAMRQYFFMDTITEVEFERERDVVRNENRQNYSGAQGRIQQLVLSSIYPKGHAYERTGIGDDRQISAITLQDAKDFVQKYYAPERATILIAGGFDVDTAVQGITKWFGKLPPRTPGPRQAVAPVTVTPGTQSFELDLDHSLVAVAFAIPPSNTPEGEACAFGLETAAFRALRAASEYDFATTVQPVTFGGRLAPVFMIFAELKDFDRKDEALEFIHKAVNQAYRGFDDESATELAEDQNLEKASFIEGLERLGQRTNTVADLIQFDRDTAFDSPDIYLFKRLDKFAQYDGARVSAAIKKYISWDKAKIVVLKATEKGLKGDTRAAGGFNKQSDEAIVNPDVDPADAMRPVLVKAELRGLTGAKHVALPNGMNLVMMPTHGMPLISARLVFRNAGAASTPEAPALAGAAAEFLHLPIDAEVFAKTGVNARCAADSDDMVCASRGISLYPDVILKALERIVRDADYSQPAIEKWQKRNKDEFTKTAQQELEFEREADAALYGADHPYTVTNAVTPEIADKIHRDALDSFNRSHYAAGNATLVLVGDFEPDKLEPLVRDTFGKWDRGSDLQPVGPATALRNGPAYIGVVAKEEPQITLFMAYPAPPGIDGLHGIRRLIADILQSRVDDIRFKLGTTYGLSAFRATQKGPTAYEIVGRVDAERAGESIKAIRDGIDAVRSGDNFNVDFVRARRKEVHNLIGGATVTSEIADRLGVIARFGLHDDFYSAMLSQIGAAPPALVKKLIASELDPSKEIIVLKGTRAQLDKAFADAGITDVKIVEPEYKP